MSWLADQDLTDQELYDECSEGLKFDKNDLDTAILHHSELLFAVGEMVARYTSIRDEAKKRMEESYAKNSLAIRELCVAEGRKVTEDTIKQMTLLDSAYKKDCNTYLKAKWECEMWSALKDAFSTRGYMIRDIGELWKASYFSIENVKGNDEMVYASQREKMAEARRQREAEARRSKSE